MEFKDDNLWFYFTLFSMSSQQESACPVWLIVLIVIVSIFIINVVVCLIIYQRMKSGNGNFFGAFLP